MTPPDVLLTISATYSHSDEIMIETVAKAQHEHWLEMARGIIHNPQGCSKGGGCWACSDMFTLYSDLADYKKDLYRSAIRTTIKALDRAGYRVRRTLDGILPSQLGQLMARLNGEDFKTASAEKQGFFFQAGLRLRQILQDEMGFEIVRRTSQ